MQPHTQTTTRLFASLLYAALHSRDVPPPPSNAGPLCVILRGRWAWWCGWVCPGECGLACERRAPRPNPLRPDPHHTIPMTPLLVWSQGTGARGAHPRRSVPPSLSPTLSRIGGSRTPFCSPPFPHGHHHAHAPTCPPAPSGQTKRPRCVCHAPLGSFLPPPQPTQASPPTRACVVVGPLPVRSSLCCTQTKTPRPRLLLRHHGTYKGTRNNQPHTPL